MKTIEQLKEAALSGESLTKEDLKHLTAEQRDAFCEFLVDTATEGMNQSHGDGSGDGMANLFVWMTEVANGAGKTEEGRGLSAFIRKVHPPEEPINAGNFMLLIAWMDHEIAVLKRDNQRLARLFADRTTH